MRFKVPAAGVTALVAALALSACSQTEATTAAETTTAPLEALTFAMPPGTDDPETLNQVDDVAALIADITGREVETENPADYMAVVEAVRNGFVDIALMSQFSTALAVENESLTPILVFDAEQLPASICIVAADSEMETIADFEGGQIAFVDPGSTTGHFMPKSMLKQNGLVDGENYTSTFAGGHDSAVLAMLNGSVDMACTARQLIPMFEEQGLLAADQYKVLAETDPIPIGMSVVVRNDLDQATRDQLTESLGEALLADESLSSLWGGAQTYQVNPGKEVYEPLMQVAKDAGVDLEALR